MLEIPCTLRCDECGRTESVLAVTRLEYPADRFGPPTFVVIKDVLPKGWQNQSANLKCPRCNGVK